MSALLKFRDECCILLMVDGERMMMLLDTAVLRGRSCWDLGDGKDIFQIVYDIISYLVRAAGLAL